MIVTLTKNVDPELLPVASLSHWSCVRSIARKPQCSFSVSIAPLEGEPRIAQGCAIAPAHLRAPQKCSARQLYLAGLSRPLPCQLLHLSSAARSEAATRVQMAPNPWSPRADASLQASHEHLVHGSVPPIALQASILMFHPRRKLGAD